MKTKYLDDCMIVMDLAEHHATNMFHLYLVKMIVYAILHLSQTIWTAMDKMMYPSGYGQGG